MAQPPAETDRKPPLFPYVAALLCVACLGAAVWTWMRYSYCWEVTPARLPQLVGDPGWEDWRGRYVRLRGYYLPDKENWLNEAGRHFGLICDDERTTIEVVQRASVPRNLDASFTGRVCGLTDILWPGSPFLSSDTYVDGRASRFTGASIAGLVVGAMGVFVFTVALRHWLREGRG